MATPWVCHLQNSGVFWYNWAAPSPKVSPVLSSGTPTLLYSTKPHLISTAPSCFLKQALPREPIYYQVQLLAQSTTSVMSGTQLLYADSQETLSRRFHLNDSLFLVTKNVSTLADQHRISQQREGFTAVVLVSCQAQLTTRFKQTRTI